MNRVSSCCLVAVRVAGRLTHYWECEFCGRPCEVATGTTIPAANVAKKMNARKSRRSKYTNNDTSRRRDNKLK